MNADENLTDQKELTTESLKDAEALLTIYGIACCPQVKARIDSYLPPENTPWWGKLPLIIDPRLTADKSEIYRDREQFRKRMQEQNEWDRQNDLAHLRGGREENTNEGTDKLNED